MDALQGRTVPWTPAVAPARGLPPFSLAHEEIDERFRFCTEALVAAPDGGVPLARGRVRRPYATSASRSWWPAASGVCACTCTPTSRSAFFAALAGAGTIERSKVDDMVLQQLEGRAAAVALVTDSTSDLPEDKAFRLGLVRVPLTLSLGDEEYLDGVDITPDVFVSRLLASAAVPRSSQPAVADFVDTYRRLLEYREGIVSVHIAGAMSGTVQAARAAARQVGDERIRVVDSRSVSVGAGLVLEAAGEAVAAGADLDEVAAAAEQAAARRARVRNGVVAGLRRARRAREPAHGAHLGASAPRAHHRLRRDGQGRQGRCGARVPARTRRHRQARRALRRRRSGACHGGAQRRAARGAVAWPFDCRSPSAARSPWYGPARCSPATSVPGL